VFLDAAAIAADGTWTIDATALPDGAYTVNATVLDSAGNQASAGPVAFTVDTMAPAITLLTPADDSVTNDATPTLSGTAELGATVQVIVRDDAGMIVFTGAPAVAADGTWSVDATALADGAYTVQASATDAAGNAASSAVNAVLIDTMAPVVVISSPADGALTAERQPTFTGTSEPGSTVTVELLDAAGAVLETFTAIADNTGAWSVGPTTAALDDGDYTVSASAIDAATNASAVTTASFTVDATALPLTIDAPTAGAVVAMTPAISGTTAPGAEVTVTLVDAQGMMIETLTATADAQGAWSVTPAALADGAYTVNAEVSSATGVTSNASAMFSVDTAAPAVAIDTPAEAAILTSTQPVISGSAEPGAALTITILDAQGATIETLTATADAQGAWSVTPAALADGAYTVNATASDAAGNSATAGPRAFSVDTSAPGVTITAPTAGQQLASTTPTITGTADPGATVTILIDGMSVGTATADASGMWSFVSPELALGSHTVEATTTDGAGNMGSSGAITFEVADMAAPVVITAPTTGGAVTGPRVTVTGTGEPGATITVTVGDKSQTVVVGEDGSWTVTFEDVPAGETTINAGDGSSMASVIITVTDAITPDDAADLVLAGGCAQGAGGSPVSGGLWLLAMGAMAWRRRRRA
jgi:large repetitive protein